MKLFSVLLALILGLFLSSCGGGGGGDEVVIQEEENGSRPARIVYDSELSFLEKQALDTSTAALGTLALNGSSIRGFSQVFGGNRSSDVVGYFERRLNYALSASTNVLGRIVSYSGLSSLYALEAVATNVGTALWVFSSVEGIGTIDFAINDRIISITSSRVGIMQVGNIFPRLHPVQQANTLVHEARHSDCTGGLTAEDLEGHRAGKLPENKKCGHLHGVCPPDHPLAGELACDSHPWGAYVIGALHSLAVSESCDSCSETEKTIAEQEAFDSLSRLLYNPDDLFEGRLGRPNMSSSNRTGE